MTAAKRLSDESVLGALGSHADATAAEVAETTSLGRSTVAKALRRLERVGRVRRRAGGREAGRRLPDHRALTTPKRPAQRRSRGRRLRPGELDGLVLDYLATHAGSSALTPTAVANGLEGEVRLPSR
jgi:hypothetical protein